MCHNLLILIFCFLIFKFQVGQRRPSRIHRSLCFVLAASGSGMCFEHTNHGRIAFTGCMHVPDRNTERYGFINKPCDIEYSFVLGYCHKVVLFGIAISEPGSQSAVGSYGLLHVVQTKVAGNGNAANGMKVYVETIAGAVHCHRRLQLPMLHFCGL